jgi:hypothetical protein
MAHRVPALGLICDWATTFERHPADPFLDLADDRPADRDRAHRVVFVFGFLTPVSGSASRDGAERMFVRSNAVCRHPVLGKVRQRLRRGARPGDDGQSRPPRRRPLPGGVGFLPTESLTRFEVGDYARTMTIRSDEPSSCEGCGVSVRVANARCHPES